MIACLSTVVDLARDAALDTVLAQLTEQYEQRTLIENRIRAETWTHSFDYLSEHTVQLRAREVLNSLLELDEPVHQQHAAILVLLETDSVEGVAELVTARTVAAEQAPGAIDIGDISRLAR